MVLLKTSQFVVWLAFVGLIFGCISNSNITISVCGDGIVDCFDEECDSSEHCSNCYCDNGYVSVDGLCVPKCEIEGCIGGCISPNECGECEQPSYQWDCHRCGKGYYMEGFMKCIPFEQSELRSCNEMMNDGTLLTTKKIELNSTLFNNTENLTFFLSDFKLTIENCFLSFDPYSPYVKGIWVELDVQEKGYYVIETEKEYTQSIVEYINAQQFSYGFDSVISVQKECFDGNPTESATCVGSSDNLNKYISSASLMTYFNEGTYYLHLFGSNGLIPTGDIQLFVKKIVHPCSERFTRISWNDMVSTVYTETVNSVDSLYSYSPCSLHLEKGKWFFIKGTDRTLMIATCDNKGYGSSFIHLIQVTKTENNLDGISCDYDESVCFGYSERGCGNNARLLRKLSSEYDYFIFVSGSEQTQIKVDFSIVCPYDCLNGICSVAKGGCICNDGFVQRNDVCTKCGNGIVDENEECDPSNTNITEYYCSKETCMCNFGYVPVTINGVTKCAIPTCGNGQIDEYEECDGGKGCDHCHCVGDYYPYAQARRDCVQNTCGNGMIDDDEECDGGDGCVECECQKDWYSNHKVDCRRYSSGEITIKIIVPGCGIYILFILLLTIFFIIRYRKLIKRIKFEIQTENSICADSIVVFDPTFCFPMDVPNEHFSIQPKTLNFMNDETCPEVEEIEEMKCLITNFSDETMKFIFHGRRDPKYDLVFTPFRGILRKHCSTEIKVQLRVHCTTVIHENIMVTVGFSHFKKLIRQHLNSPPPSAGRSNKSEKSQKSGRSSFSSVSNQNSTSSEEVIVKPQKAKQFSVTLCLEAQSKLSSRLDCDEVSMSQFPIGQGTFGIVYKGQWRRQDVAVKSVKTDVVSIEDLLPSFNEEVKLLERLRSPCIVSFIGYWINEDSICLVLEYCPLGSLKKYLQSTPTPVKLKFRFCQDIARGMLYLHENDIIHRDLKPDNVLVTSENPLEAVVCKVSDFGTSKCFIEQPGLIAKKDVGTPMYMAPEIHMDGILNKKSDVFSYAICLLEIWLGKSPYDSIKFPDSESIMTFSCSGQRLEIPNDCPYKKIIAKCWHKKYKKRPSFNDIVDALSKVILKEKHNASSFVQLPVENQRTDHETCKSVGANIKKERITTTRIKSLM